MNDFDFFIGSWNVVNRKLATLFAGSDDWNTFPGTTTCRPMLRRRRADLGIQLGHGVHPRLTLTEQLGPKGPGCAFRHHRSSAAL